MVFIIVHDSKKALLTLSIALMFGFKLTTHKVTQHNISTNKFLIKSDFFVNSPKIILNINVDK